MDLETIMDNGYCVKGKRRDIANIFISRNVVRDNCVFDVYTER